MQKSEKVIETRKTEIRFKTSDPKEMIGKFLAERLLRGWMEDFVDEETGAVVQVERNEVIADRGQLIDGDLLSMINFHLQCGDIKEVTVSNQRREGVLVKNNFLFPWLATVRIGTKNHKFLLYAISLETAIEVTKDFVELNYAGGFYITQLKEYSSCIILRDNLKKYLPDEELGFDPVDEEEEIENLKFYQIDATILTDETREMQTFVVETKDAEKAMVVINDYVNRQNQKQDYKYENIEVKLETAKIISCDRFIEKEFSLAYSEL